MDLRPLGSSGILVSPLGLGTVKIGRNQQVKYPRDFTIPDDAAVRDLLALARDLGINLVDTAPAYGNSEERLGALLPDPQNWVVVTKVGEIFEQGQSRFDFSARATRESVESSLRRMRREVLDVVLVHSSGDDMHIILEEDVFPTLENLKQEGLLRAYGMSGKTAEGGLWTVQHTDVVMATCNRAEPQDLAVIEEAHDLNKGVLVKKGLQSGHADTGAGGAGVEDAIRYVLRQPGVSSLIVGTINPQHLRANVATAQAVLAELR